jgi:Ca2+-binding RTX toxin-like protein
VVDNTSDVVTEVSGEGTDTVNASVSYTISDADVENLTLTGSSGINATGNSSANTLTGNSGANTLVGGAGADTLDGGADVDNLIGGAGNDTYVVDNTSDVVTEVSGEGTDTVNASVSYTLSSEVENLTLTGSGNINGTGNASANTLTGNSGANTLAGGTGVDTFTGGDGADAFNVEIFDATYDLSSIDVIRDFSTSQSDTLKILESGVGLTSSNLRGNGTGFQAADFKGGTALDANTGFLVNSGSNSSDLNIATIISELASGDTQNSITASDAFFYLTDDGTNSSLFRFSDANNNAAVDSGEVVAIAILENVSDATLISETFVTDFVI